MGIKKREWTVKKWLKKTLGFNKSITYIYFFGGGVSKKEL